MKGFKKNIPYNELPLLSPKGNLETTNILRKTITAIENIFITNDELHKMVVADKKSKNPAVKELISYKNS